MDKPKQFRKMIAQLLPKKKHGYTEAGSRVMPVLELYAKLESYEDKIAFQNALEMMLVDPDSELRRFAVDICLGFFVFRNSL